MSKNQNGLDKTSVVMIAVFAVLVLASVVAVGFVAVGRMNDRAEQTAQDLTDVQIDNLADNGGAEKTTEGGTVDEIMNGLTNEEIAKLFPNAQPGDTFTYVDDDGNFKNITIPDDYNSPDAEHEMSVEESVAASEYKFENYTDLTDKFMEVCKSGDIDALYGLYFDDYLTKMRENMESVPTKQIFDANIRAEMLAIVDYEEFEYGCPELLNTQAPSAYVAQIYYFANNSKTLPLTSADIQNCVDLRVYTNTGGYTDHMMAQIGGYWYFIV